MLVGKEGCTACAGGGGRLIRCYLEFYAAHCTTIVMVLALCRLVDKPNPDKMHGLRS